jgi:hypothetical protein
MFMPTAMRLGKFRFFFFSNEGDEPRHIHVESGSAYAKFWLEPVDLAKSVGYKNNELAELRRIIEDRRLLLKARWDAHFGS